MTSTFFVMEILLAIVLAIIAGTNYSSDVSSSLGLETDQATELEYVAETTCEGIIVMEDVIAIVDTCEPSNYITGFTVYDQQTQNAVYSAGGCSNSCESYDLSQLAADTYFAEATTTSGEDIEAYITVE